MAETKPQPYQVEKITVIARSTDVFVREYVLGPGESIPWHHHTQVSDHYYSLAGTVLIETRAPLVRHELRPGVGTYDFVKES